VLKQEAVPVNQDGFLFVAPQTVGEMGISF
jgi:hypothetical protein